ncbi:hypothetical protein CaCOL14_013156 [Colletotrichum acutatum]
MSAATIFAEFRALILLPQADPGRAQIPGKWDALCRQWWSETRDADKAETEESDWARLIRQSIPHDQLDQVLGVIYEPDIDEVTGDALIRLNRACLSLGLTKPIFFLIFGANIARSTQSLKYISGLCNPRSAPGNGHSPNAVIAAVRLAMRLRHKSARAFPIPAVRDVTTARKKRTTDLQAAAAAVPEAAIPHAEENVEEPRALSFEKGCDDISIQPLEPFPSPRIPSPRIISPLIHSPQFHWPEDELLSQLVEETAALSLVNEDDEMEDGATVLLETEEEEEEEEEEEDEEEEEEEEKEEENDHEDLTDHWVRLCRELSDLPIPPWVKGSTNMTFQGCRVLATAVVTRVLEIDAATKNMSKEEGAAPQ